MTRTLLLLLVPTIAAADPHPMASGASPSPGSTTDVALTQETLTIAIELRDASVTAAITLVNKGAATTLDVGFPCSSGDSAGQVDVPCKVPLTVTANKKPVRTTKDKSHWIWKMKFAANESVDLVISYKAPLINPRYDVPVDGMGLFTYRLTTGAQWAGTIDKLAIEVDHANDALLFVSPAGYQREPGKITWTLENYEPTEELVIMPAPEADVAFAFGGKTIADKRKQLANGDFKKADIQSSIDRLTQGGYIGERWPGIISKLGGVPTPTPQQVKTGIAESVKVLQTLAARASR